MMRHQVNIQNCNLIKKQNIESRGRFLISNLPSSNEQCDRQEQSREYNLVSGKKVISYNKTSGKNNTSIFKHFLITSKVAKGL